MSPQQFRLLNQIFDKAVELPPDERAAYLNEVCGDDLELRREAEDLLRADEHAEHQLDRSVIEAAERLKSAQPTLVGRYVGPYKIVREIGSGGMGTVYEAVRTDNQYVRSVAIKFVSTGMETPDALTRFRVERQVLAALQHPNVAMLLDGGTSDDGRPYIVMEYVKGKPLLDYCRERDASIQERLRLFCDLCEAVHHAHQMLVIHRDIKPANVLVTESGQPKLLDFGIAKLLTPELVPDGVPTTRTMARRMTPRYASPEQVLGDQLTTATDIYSLGVLLYELLTYSCPYRTTTGSDMEFERAVVEQDPARLSTAAAKDPHARKELSGDLENIVAMAMRKEPHRRYASAQQFAEDIRRYLAGLPVAAREDTIFYLTGKLIRRNKLASVAFFLLAVSIAVGWTMTIREARQTEARFQEVRDLANTLLRDITRDLRGIPGTIPVRAKVVKTALSYLDRLSREETSDTELQHDLARAYDRVGDAQGDPGGPNLGLYSDAIVSYRHALALAGRVAAERRDGDLLNTMAWLHLKIGDLQWRTGKGKASLASYEEGVRIGASMQAEFGELRGHNVQREGHQKIARALTASRRLDEALNHANLAIAAAEKQAQQRPDLGDAGIATARMIRGDVLGVSGRMEKSRADYEDAVTRLEQAAKAEPNEWAVLEDLADAYRRLGDLLGAPIYFNYGESRLAEEYLTRALVLEEQMRQMEPQSVPQQSRVALAYRRLASVQRETDTAAAIRNYEKAIAMAEELLRVSPEDLNYRRELAIHRQVYGLALHRAGRRQAAQEQTERAIETQRRLVADVPTRTVLQEDLFHSLLALGDLRLAGGQADEARRQYDEAAAIAETLRDQDPNSLYAERSVALSLEAIGNAHRASGRKREAADAYRNALAVWTRWKDNGIASPFAVRKEREVSRLLAATR